jgi:hypothetical protein
MQGGLTVWIMLMFGVSVILYLFGYTNMWSAAQTNVEVNGESVGNASSLGSQQNILAWFLNPINILVTATLGLGVVGVVLHFLPGLNAGSSAYQFIIPIAILGVANIFVFPIADAGGELRIFSMTVSNGLSFSFDFALIAFFNLILILAMIEFITGRQT